MIHRQNVVRLFVPLLYQIPDQTMEKNIIFSMMGVSKTLPQNNKTIIKDIHLSFFYGAKIGIIGLNGSGKSTLLRIIAGVDQNYQGKVEFQKGYTVGFL